MHAVDVYLKKLQRNNVVSTTAYVICLLKQLVLSAITTMSV